MTTETQRRIRAYKRMLPELRERVIAVALLLAMSVSMLGSASFAWITLSRAPEVSGMSTTVAANGNLEIALAQGSTAKAIKPPEESAVGDSSANQGIVDANVTWGNLINLSDPIYGISDIALRPASLSTSGLTETPLYGANYGEDGRVKNTLAEYQFASWKYDPNGDGYFDAGDVNYGVRAITSIKYDNVTTNATLKGFWDNIDGEKGKYPLAKQGYDGLIRGKTTVGTSKTGLQALTDMIQLYAQDQVDKVKKEMIGLGSGPKDDYSSCITYFYRLMQSFMEILEYEGEALRQLANLQVFLKDSSKGENYFESLDDLLNATDLTALGVNLESLKTFKSDYTNLKKYVDPESPDSISQLAADYDPEDPKKKDKVSWDTIEPAVASLVDISETKLNGTAITSLANASWDELLALLDEGKTHSVVIGKGILKNTEERLGIRSGIVGVQIVIKVTVLIGTTNVTAKVSTTAEPNANGRYVSDQDIYATEEKQGGSVIQGTDPVSKDTYGMAIDLWVRTNAKDSILTLEGHKVYNDEPVLVKDDENNDQPLYIMTSGNQQFEVYQKGGTGSWYYASSHQPVEAGVAIDDTKPVIDSTVIGFEGENRVWGNDSLVWEDMVHDGHIAQDRTTQGAGSCFVFYANPSDQNSIMKMLDAFSIFFMDENGLGLGKAYLNTKDAYAINGKVTVPIEMLTGTDYTTLDEYGIEQPHTGITPLVQNTAKRITAIIYLDGDEVDNKNVLAAGEIQGQLNLQFGSSAELNSVNDEALQLQYRSITATASYNNEISTDENSAIDGANGEGLPYDGKPKTIHVTLEVDGDQPQSISGFFVRSINATQGTRDETKEFRKNDDGTWSADFDLTKPGKYMLRSVVVDGVEYSLMRKETDQNGNDAMLPAYPTVLITGLNVSNVRVTNAAGLPVASGEYMTADDRWQLFVEAQVTADAALMPSQVRAVFMGTNGQEFNAIMSYDENTNKWSGSTNITRTGTYTLEYLVLDSDYTEIDGPTYTVKLGMKARVWAHPDEATDAGGELLNLTSTEFEFTETVIMPISVEIWNDADEEMEDLNGKIELYYHDSTGVDAYGLHTPLEWDGKDRYRGSFALDEPGRYTFNRVDIELTGSTEVSEVRKADFAPRIAPVSPYAPVYHSDVTDDLQLIAMTGNTASIKVVIPYATDDVAAKIVDQNSQNDYAVVRGHATGDKVPVSVDGRGVQANVYEFQIPTSKTYGAQDGEWKIKTLYFWGVYADGQYIEALPDSGEMDTSKSYSFNVPNAESTYVIATLTPELTRGTDSDGNPTVYTGEALGGTSTENATATFMTAQSVAPVTVRILDWNGQLVPQVDQVQWKLTYTGKDETTNTETSMIYGGYTSDYLEAGRVIGDPLVLTNPADGKFTTPDSFALTVAGKFTSSFNVDFKTSEDDKATVWRAAANPKDDVVFTVASQRPTVTVSAVTPSTTTTHSVDETTSGSIHDSGPTPENERQSTGCNPETIWDFRYTTNAKHKSGYRSSISQDNKTAEVHFVCEHTNDATYLGTKGAASADDGDKKYHHYTAETPTVTLALSNTGNLFRVSGSSAVLNFVEENQGEVRMYTTYSSATYGIVGIGFNRYYFTELANQTSTYSWTSETTCRRYIGHMEQKIDAGVLQDRSEDDIKTPAGTITANQLTVNYNNNSYTFTIDTVTIKNPY